LSVSVLKIIEMIQTVTYFLLVSSITFNAASLRFSIFPLHLYSSASTMIDCPTCKGFWVYWCILGYRILIHHGDGERNLLLPLGSEESLRHDPFRVESFFNKTPVHVTVNASVERMIDLKFALGTIMRSPFPVRHPHTYQQRDIHPVHLPVCHQWLDQWRQGFSIDPVNMELIVCPF